jgi:hypothetical protein
MPESPALELWQELSSIQIIRTETVLSKLPVHNLSKTGNFEILIHRRKPTGEVELHWSVSYNSKYGPPRQLAYKLDTLVVNRKIDEIGRPVPKVVKLGSLRDIARELDLGGDTNQIRKALRQNAFTAITAKLTYRTAAGEERRIEADFTRYSVIFAGEKLPDGTSADSVHLILNEPYWEVLNSAPIRPLNYEYLRELPPAAQRFYEIVSYRVYAALKYGQSEAKLAYSEFCTCSALQRYFDYDPFKKQMYKIHKRHLESGYLERVYYQETQDADGQPDWNMIYVPGDRARREFEAFHQRRQSLGEGTVSDSPVLGELLKRGISESQARRLTLSLKDGQPVQAQLEWGDVLVTRSRGRIENPPGFYIYLVRENVMPPVEFVRSPGEPQIEDDRVEQRAAYNDYVQGQAAQYLQKRYGSEEYERLIEAKGREVKQQYRVAETWSKEQLREVAEGLVRRQVAGEAPVMGFDEFCKKAVPAEPSLRSNTP